MKQKKYTARLARRSYDSKSRYTESGSHRQLGRLLTRENDYDDMQYTPSDIRRQTKGTILQKDRQNYVKDMAKEDEKAASYHEMGNVFQITQKLCGKKSNINISVTIKQGTLLPLA